MKRRLIKLADTFKEVNNTRRSAGFRAATVQALAVNIVIVILSIVLGWTVVLACVPLLLWFVTLYWAFKAYQGEYFEIPGLTGFLKGQGWI